MTQAAPALRLWMGAALAAAAPAALLLGALGFEHIGGLAPCKLCMWQRWPHVAAAALGGLALFAEGRARRALIAAAGLAILASAGVGVFHMGVEQGWWEGPTTCSGGAGGAATVDALREQLLAAPLVRCDEVAWSLFGVSMAGWNALISGGLGLILGLIALRGARP